jgi:hypothetical protein
MLKETTGEPGIAITTEYILLLGVSILIFTAVFIGFSSFVNTASADARSAAAYRIVSSVGECIADASMSGSEVTCARDLPERICGSAYVIYPAKCGHSLCVLVNGQEYEVPVVVPAGLKLQGFMISAPQEHRIVYDPQSAAITIS